MTTPESPDRMLSTALVKAWLADAHALVTVNAGTEGGTPEPSAISLAIFGVLTEGMTFPINTLSISFGAISVLFRSSTAAIFPRSREERFSKSVPDFANGVLRPRIMATRFPLLSGLNESSERLIHILFYP
jgi:hypothetical protein